VLFVADENVSERLVRMLDALESQHEVRHLLDYFKPGTPDVAWLNEMCTWDTRIVILSGDGRILMRGPERRALKQCGASFIVFQRNWHKHHLYEPAAVLVRAWPQIIRDCTSLQRPGQCELMWRAKLVKRAHID